jgi:hypothetical protein
LGVVESLADSELELVQNWDYVLQKEVQIFSLVISSKLRSCYRLKVQSCIVFLRFEKKSSASYCLCVNAIYRHGNAGNVDVYSP